jgi:hypothetical protein
MQEQLPLRPSEFVKIRDGFVAFLKLQAGRALEAVIPLDVIAKMEAAARKGATRQKLLSFIQISGVIVAVAGIVIAMAVDPMLPGACLLVGGGGVFIWAHRQSRRRSEPEIDELTSDPLVQSRLRALDNYKALIAEGEIPCEERMPDGTHHPLSAAKRAAFLADHSSLLLLSRRQELWACMPKRPIPLSPLWVKIGNRVATSLISARTILDTPDRELFDARTQWLLDHADQNNSKATSFREGVQIIIALRRPDFNGMTFEQKKQTLVDEGFSASRIEKMHAGIYQPFNAFLAKLPLHEFP